MKSHSYKNVLALPMVLIVTVMVFTAFISCKILKEPHFIVEKAHVVQVDVPPGAADPFVTDPETGYSFRFPDGGSGELEIAKIVAGPKAPFPGEGISVTYSGAELFEIVIDGADDGVSDFPMVFGYGKIEGMFDDAAGNGYRWVAVPWSQLEGRRAFELTLPEEPFIPPLVFSVKGAAAPVPSTKYWISKLAGASGDVEKRNLISLQVGDYRDAFLATLNDTRRLAVQARIDQKTLTIEHDSSYYSGFWWRSLGSLGRIYKPTIHISLDAFSLAHETGHELTHMLVGDDVPDAREGPGSFFAGHGIRDTVGRAVVVEEYAYFTEFFFIGTGGQYNLQDPYAMWGGRTPLAVDFPSLEGFGATMLASLVRTDTSMRDAVLGRDVYVPTAGIGYGAVFDIIAMGATDINTLRANIQNALPDSSIFPVILHRLGWRYSVKAKLVNKKNKPVVNAKVEPLLIVENTEYQGVKGEAASGLAGEVRIFGDAFGGSSVLRITPDGKDPVDKIITIPWDDPTDKTIDLGKIVINTGDDEEPSVAGDYYFTFNGTGCGPNEREGMGCSFTADESGALAMGDCAMDTTASGTITATTVSLSWDYYHAYSTPYGDVELTTHGTFDGTANADRTQYKGTAQYTISNVWPSGPVSCTKTADATSFTKVLTQ